jgi:hypothetical protein
MCFFDIQRSKLVIVKLHYAKASKMYNCLVFSTNLGNIICQNCFWKEKLFLDTNVNIGASSIDFQQITWAYYF